MMSSPRTEEEMWASWADGDDMNEEQPQPSAITEAAGAGEETLGPVLTCPVATLPGCVGPLPLVPAVPFGQQPPSAAAESKVGDLCEVCGSGKDADAMLLCDGCVEGYHMHCLTPPLTAIPDGDWFCVTCEKLDARKKVLSEAEAVRVARRWYDNESDFGAVPGGMGYRMKVVKAFRNSARVWSLRYKTVPTSGGALSPPSTNGSSDP